MDLNKIYSYIFLVSIFLFSSCGRKQKNIFSFAPEPDVKINKLDLPAVRGLSITKTKDGMLLSWLDLFSRKSSPEINSLQKNFVGYDVFKLTKKMFIPRTPLNKAPLTTTQFLDRSNAHTKKSGVKSFYLIQSVFKFDNQIIKGPSSQVVGIKI
jgi:PBP1b-binding outer membrane lipoprotein LpoB